MELNSENLTYDQIVCRMADGHELVSDDLGDWLFSGVHWTILPEDTVKELSREGLVVRYHSTELQNDGSFEERYKLTPKGLKLAGLVAPMVSIKLDDEAHAAMHVVFWIVMAICLATLVTYRLLNG